MALTIYERVGGFSSVRRVVSAFDRIVELFNCERMKTIGDAYMAVAGIPEESSDHAQTPGRWSARSSACSATSTTSSVPA
jgi:class 3 adenylate cyclase